ncbi:hypothetical protein WMF27_03595 [Sorangium sp. So ce281]|uniref:hypothetical protein n=1 Tax=Sorangium sp. So ce281 TaxID=3133293 RepID=UPI003F5DD328
MPRSDDDPTIMDLRSLALKSFTATLPAATTTSSVSAAGSVAPGSGPVAPAAVGLTTPQATRGAESTAATAPSALAGTAPVGVDAPSVSDVMRVHDALVPVAVPSRARSRARVRILAAATVAGALVIAVGLTLIAGRMSRAPGDDVVPPAARRGVSRAAEIAREVSVPVEAPGPRRTALRGLDARAPATDDDGAGAAEPVTAPQPRAAPEAGAREASGAGGRPPAAPGARARPERQPSPSLAPEEASRPQAPISLTDAMAAAVADPPAPAAVDAQRQADTSEE